MVTVFISHSQERAQTAREALVQKHRADLIAAFGRVLEGAMRWVGESRFEASREIACGGNFSGL